MENGDFGKMLIKKSTQARQAREALVRPVMKVVMANGIRNMNDCYREN